MFRCFFGRDYQAKTLTLCHLQTDKIISELVKYLHESSILFTAFPCAFKLAFWWCSYRFSVLANGVFADSCKQFVRQLIVLNVTHSARSSNLRSRSAWKCSPALCLINNYDGSLKTPSVSVYLVLNVFFSLLLFRFWSSKLNGCVCHSCWFCLCLCVGIFIHSQSDSFRW